MLLNMGVHVYFKFLLLNFVKLGVMFLAWFGEKELIFTYFGRRGTRKEVRFQKCAPLRKIIKQYRISTVFTILFMIYYSKDGTHVYI